MRQAKGIKRPANAELGAVPKLSECVWVMATSKRGALTRARVIVEEAHVKGAGFQAALIRRTVRGALHLWQVRFMRAVKA